MARDPFTGLSAFVTESAFVTCPAFLMMQAVSDHMILLRVGIRLTFHVPGSICM